MLPNCGAHFGRYVPPASMKCVKYFYLLGSLTGCWVRVLDSNHAHILAANPPSRPSRCCSQTLRGNTTLEMYGITYTGINGFMKVCGAR